MVFVSPVLLDLVVNRLQLSIRQGDALVLELAIWLGVSGIETARPKDEASGLLWTPRDVGLAGLRHATGRSTTARPFAAGLAALTSREFFVPYSPGVLEADPLAILAIAIGVHSLGEEGARQWIAGIAHRAIADEADPWRIGLLTAAGVLVGGKTGLPGPPELAVAIAKKCALVFDRATAASALSTSLTLDDPPPDRAVFRLRALHVLTVGPTGIQSEIELGFSTAPPPLPRLCTVLLVSASPDNEVRLRVDKEFRDIISRVRGGRLRDSFSFVQVQAARYSDIATALQEFEPQVLHISAHGDPDGALLLEGDSGTLQKLPKRKFLKLLAALAESLRLVVLNACYSHVVAREIPSVIDLAIGMGDKVTDQAAVDFSVAFYESLAFGKPVETAFCVALAGLEDVDDEIPLLFPSVADDLESKRRRSLVDL